MAKLELSGSTDEIKEMVEFLAKSFIKPDQLIANYGASQLKSSSYYESSIVNDVDTINKISQELTNSIKDDKGALKTIIDNKVSRIFPKNSLELNSYLKNELTKDKLQSIIQEVQLYSIKDVPDHLSKYINPTIDLAKIIKIPNLPSHFSQSDAKNIIEQGLLDKLSTIHEASHINMIEVKGIWDLKGMAEAVKNGANKSELTRHIDEHSNFDNIMDHQIMECSRWTPDIEKGGAFGCADKQDVLYLLDQGIIAKCQSEVSLSVANKQYLASQSDDSYYFNFTDWTTVCNFSEEQIKTYIVHQEN